MQGSLAGWHAKPAERKLLRKISPRGPMEIQDDIERYLRNRQIHVQISILLSFHELYS
ncbi:hypothetical protein HYC85_005420 [Camellia sinensis]|uniref:Uncharacterized protein n=1 Tax=Camellia sinensis TaxID=4442 RepID=A0A7J7I0E7_CAMSI|nr:hypothetical protein HYC85_005420 [Camellia sinensis]